MSQGTVVEEIRYFGDGDGGRFFREVGLRDGDHGDGWAGGHEVAHNHGSADKDCNPNFISMVPVHISKRIPRIGGKYTISMDHWDQEMVLATR